MKSRGSASCELLQQVEYVAAQRETATSIMSYDMETLVGEKTRRSITDPYQRLLFEVKALHRKGKFKTSQGEGILQRVHDISNGRMTVLDLSGLFLCDEFVDLLVSYLRSKVCKLLSLNLSRTSIRVQAVILIARATNSTLQTLQFSEHPIPVEKLRSQAVEDGQVDFSGHDFNHLDAAAIGVLLERVCTHVRNVDLSGNQLTGPKATSFHGIIAIFECLKHCHQLQEINLDSTNLRSDGLAALANVVQDFPMLETLNLSRNKLAHNSANESRLSGIEPLCNVLWRVKTLRTLSLTGNHLDYLSSVQIAAMLKVNCAIVSLSLAQNPLGDAGAVDLSTALKKNATLTSLNLSDCQLTCEGMSELAMVLRKFNNTLQAIDITDNPNVRSQGYRSLAKCLLVNHKVTNIVMNPSPRYEKYAQKIQALVAVNTLLNAVQTDPKRFATFPALSETQRMNFVAKLERFSESELLQFHEERIVENATRHFGAKETACLSVLHHYAAMEQYGPLKRLLWYFEVDNRHQDLVNRSNNMTNANGEEDDEDVWDYPLI